MVQLVTSILPSLITLALAMWGYIQLSKRVDLKIRADDAAELTEAKRKSLDAEIAERLRQDELVKSTLNMVSVLGDKMGSLAENMSRLVVSQEQDRLTEMERLRTNERVFEAQERIIREQLSITDENTKSTRAIAGAFGVLNLAITDYQHDMLGRIQKLEEETIQRVFERLNNIDSNIGDLSTKVRLMQNSQNQIIATLAELGKRIIEMKGRTIIGVDDPLFPATPGGL